MLALAWPSIGPLEVGLVSGLGVGALYALVAVAYNLVLAASGVFNLAQGATIALATVLTFFLGQHLGWSLPATFAAVVIVGAAAGSVSELVAVRLFIGQGGVAAEETLVSTLGMGLVIVAVAALVFGADAHPVPSYVPALPLHVLGLLVQPIYAVMLVTIAVVGVLIEVILRYTKIGVITRAIIADPEGAASIGVPVFTTVHISFVVAGALGALAGFLIAPITAASPYVGDSIALYGFAGLAIGGFGSFRGAILGSLLVGLAASMAQVFFSPEYARPIVFALLLGTLVLRPAGIFGKAGMFGARASREV